MLDKHNTFGKKGLKVEVKNGNVMAAWQHLKKVCQDEGLPQAIKRHQFYEKPSEIKKRKKAQAVKREKKRQREANIFEDITKFKENSTKYGDYT